MDETNTWPEYQMGLTDYGHLPDSMSEVESSKLRETKNSVTVTLADRYRLAYKTLEKKNPNDVTKSDFCQRVASLAESSEPLEA